MFRNSTKALALLILLIASFNLARQFYQMYEESVARQKMYEQHIPTEYWGPSGDENMRMYIEPFLILLSAGALLKGLKGKLLEVVGLAGASFFYALWWPFYFKLARLTETESQLRDIRHLAYLYNANYFDICIAILLSLSTVLYVWWALQSIIRLKAHARVSFDSHPK